jgi:Tol biopolymer transport system component
MVDLANLKTINLLSSTSEISQLRWSRDRKNLAYVMENPVPTKNPDAPLKPILIAPKKLCSNIWLMNVNLEKTRPITHYSLQGRCDAITDLTFSPNSEKLVYSHLPSGEDPVWAFGKIAEIDLSNAISHTPRFKATALIYGAAKINND